MENKKFVFILSSPLKKPVEAVGLMRVASNMKAFDSDVVIDFFLIDEGVLLAKKGVAETIIVELEGQKSSVGELMDILREFDVKFFVCHAFMPVFGVKESELIDSAEIKSSSYLGELLLEGRIPLSINL